MLPTITWFISSASIPDREMTSLATVVPRSTAGTSLRDPPKVPTAVLKGVEITISVPLPLAKLMLLLYSVATYPILPLTKRPNGTNATAALPPTTLVPGPLNAGSIKLERGVEEPHIGIHPLLGEVLEDLLLLGGGLQEQRPAALELVAERFDDVFEEVLGELHVPFLRLARALDNVPVCVQALFERAVGLFLALERSLQGLHGGRHGVRQGPVALGLARVRLDHALRPVLRQAHAPLLSGHGPTHRLLHGLQTCLRGVLRLVSHESLLSVVYNLSYSSETTILFFDLSGSKGPGHERGRVSRPGLSNDTAVLLVTAEP